MPVMRYLLFVSTPVPCQNMLGNPRDDCASSASRQDLDTIYPGPGQTVCAGSSSTRGGLVAPVRDN